MDLVYRYFAAAPSIITSSHNLPATAEIRSMIAITKATGDKGERLEER
jgi:hypothetical protein